MRFLIAHNQYGAMSGEERALEAIAGLLEQNGHQIKWFLRSSAQIQGLREKAGAFFSGIHSFAAARALREFLKNNRIEAALVQNLYPFLSPSILPVFKEFKIPVVMRCPNYRLFCPNGLHLSRGEICERCLGGKEYWCVIRDCENSLFKSLGYAARNAAARIGGRIGDYVDVFIVLSEFQRHRFIAGGIPPEKITVIPNIAPIAEKASGDDPGRLVSFVGRISPEKGIEDFLAAAERLPHIPFAVAGNIKRMPDVKHASPRNVRWMGFLQGEHLDEFYRTSRILVFPGKWFEGFPNVIASAMGAGKPVVASRLGAIPEIVDHDRTGLLFAPGRVDELTECIRDLYENPDQCRSMGRAGRVKAEACYGGGVVYGRWMEVLSVEF